MMVFKQSFDFLRSGRWRQLLLMLMLTLGLTGCMDAQTNIHYASPNAGTIVQHIKLGSQLTTAQGWLNALESQARRLDGKVQRPSRQELNVTIPFYNGADLERKFNQLLNPPQPKGSDLPAIAAKLRVNTSNLILLQRHHLVYDLDLSALGVQDEDGELLLDAGSALDMSFGVTGPWGAGGRGAQKQPGGSLWRLQSGQPNHLEANLWMPSGLGLGSAAIVGLVVAGTYYSKQVKP
jgi:hypothetical protein